ncbi:hypothetical protein NDU88_002412 [Pleurodeles waltl]|uniref:Uncharacterized protein n=1 Tax=Pleurodeles waltl TaxID=8319 RepID=A0AAV7KVB5_PLEWA|nr:hypothetical protein NDU88_002412 [Pleurodeles waltl]
MLPVTHWRRRGLLRPPGPVAELRGPGGGRRRPPGRHGHWSVEAHGVWWRGASCAALDSADVQARPVPSEVGPCWEGLVSVIAGRIGPGDAPEGFFGTFVGPLGGLGPLWSAVAAGWPVGGDRGRPGGGGGLGVLLVGTLRHLGGEGLAWRILGTDLW